MTALPSSIEFQTRFSDNSIYLSAYETLLRLEAGADDDSTLRAARVLGFLFWFGPSDPARTLVAQSVNSCMDDSDLTTLGHYYISYFIRLFRTNKCRTQAPSGDVSGPSYGTTESAIQQLLKRVPQNHLEAKNSALARDGLRCVITGICDWNLIQNIAELKARVLDSGEEGQETECAHVLPGTTNFNIQTDAPEYVASAWTLLERFGFGDVLEDLNGAGVHRLENVMTMTRDIHSAMEYLQVWFEATDTPNEYELCTTDPEAFQIRRWPKKVKFTTDTDFPLPSPRYLFLHACCAKIAHMSGAAEYLDKHDRDMESTLVLASEGSDASVLEGALQQALAGFSNRVL